MSFTDQKPFVFTREGLLRRWAGHKDGRVLRCAICAHFFAEGDTARWVYTNGQPNRAIQGNPFVCVRCDGPGVLERLCEKAAAWEALSESFWFFLDSEHRSPNPHVTALREQEPSNV